MGTAVRFNHNSLIFYKAEDPSQHLYRYNNVDLIFQ